MVSWKEALSICGCQTRNVIPFDAPCYRQGMWTCALFLFLFRVNDAFPLRNSASHDKITLTPTFLEKQGPHSHKYPLLCIHPLDFNRHFVQKNGVSVAVTLTKIFSGTFHDMCSCCRFTVFGLWFFFRLTCVQIWFYDGRNSCPLPNSNTNGNFSVVRQVQKVIIESCLFICWLFKKIEPFYGSAW